MSASDQDAASAGVVRRRFGFTLPFPFESPMRDDRSMPRHGSATLGERPVRQGVVPERNDGATMSRVGTAAERAAMP